MIKTKQKPQPEFLKKMQKMQEEKQSLEAMAPREFFSFIESKQKERQEACEGLANYLRLEWAKIKDLKKTIAEKEEALEAQIEEVINNMEGDWTGSIPYVGSEVVEIQKLEDAKERALGDFSNFMDEIPKE